MLDMSQEAILAKILKTDENKVKEALSLTNDYQTVKCPKKGGGYRLLCIPPEPLKKIQKRLYRHLLRKLWRVWYFGFFGIYKKTSYVVHAEFHKNAKWVFQFDLKDAFPSVNVLSLRECINQKVYEGMIDFEESLSLYRDGLERAGITDEEVDTVGRGDMFYNDFRYLKRHKREVINSAFFPLQHLVAKKRKDDLFFYPYWKFPEKEEIAKAITDLTMELTNFQGFLPQGTPTAPFIFYLALVESGILSELNSICPFFYPTSQDRYGFHISAYIDNFVISAQKPIPLKNQRAMLRIVEKSGFKINARKTRHQGIRHGAPLITGLCITDDNGEGKVTVSKRKIRRWRGLIHRAIFEPELRQKVKGLIASLRPIYGAGNIMDWNYFATHGRFPQKPILPPQLEKPYQDLLLKIEQEGV